MKKVATPKFGTGLSRLVSSVSPGPNPSASLLISRHSSGRYLVDGLGNPWLAKGEACWCANTAGSPNILNSKGFSQNSYMSIRSSQGLNCFSLQLLSKYQTNAPNDYDNIPPFTTVGDIRTPNDTYFNRARDLIIRAASYGMVVFVAPCWFGWTGLPSQGWLTELQARTIPEIQTYITYVVNKFVDLDNIIWINGGDYTGALNIAIPNAISSAIRAADSRHLITAHWTVEPSDYYYGDWLDIRGCYKWGGIVREQVISQYNAVGPVSPVVMLEALYKDNVEFGANRKILRFQAASSFLSGAVGYLYGEEANWHSGSEDTNLPSQSRGWAFSTSSAEFFDYKKVLDLISARQWHTFVPDTGNTLITNDRSSGTSYITATKTPSGNCMIANTPNGASITVNLAQLSGTLLARWYDPVSGAFTNIGTFSAAGSQTFTIPGNNSIGDNDWFLVLES